MNKPLLKVPKTDSPGAPGWLRWSAIVAGLVGFLLFVATPLLPVNQTQSTVTWPQHDSLNSINAPLIAVAPESLEAEIPLQAKDFLRPGQTLLYGTVPVDSEDAHKRGLFVDYDPNTGLTVSTLDRVVFDLTPRALATVPADGTLKIEIKADKLLVSLGWYKEKYLEDLRPQVTGVYTELDDSPAARAALGDMRVHVEVNSRFTSTPSLYKSLAMWLGLALMIFGLFVLRAVDKAASAKPAGWAFPRPRPIDALVAVVLLWWYFFGANTSDDGFILTMARVSEHSGYMANYYRWYGVPESPFGSPYYDLLGWLASISPASTVVRLPSLVAGFAIWFMLSRELLPRFGAVISGRRMAYWTAGLMFLAFWLPFNNGTRPEPMVALGVTLTWVCFERAIASRRLLPAAVGVIVATVTLAVGPTGLFAVGIFLVCLPQLLALIKERAKYAGWLPLIAPFLACGTAILTVVFADQTLAAVLESTDVRAKVGPSLPWHAEFARYTGLFQASADGSLARRFPVFVMIFCLGLILYAFLKDHKLLGTPEGPTRRLLLIYGSSLFFLMFTPTKWTHHFGIYAGVGSVIAALGAVVLWRLAMSSSHARSFAAAAVFLLVAQSFAGWNAWWYVASFGIPWWDRNVSYHAHEAATVFLALALLLFFIGIAQYFRSRGRRKDFATEAEHAANESARLSHGAVLMSAPLAVACAVMVAFSMASFAKGFVHQYPAYSIGKGNLATLKGDACGMASDVLVEENTGSSFLTPLSGPLGQSLEDPQAVGFGPDKIPTDIETDSSASAVPAGKAIVPTDPSAAAASVLEDKGLRAEPGVNGSHHPLPFNLDYRQVPVMGSYAETQKGKATLTTQWFKLPARSAATPLVVVSAAGEIFHHDVNNLVQPGQQLTLEYGRLDNGKVTLQGKGEFSDVGASPDWRNLRFPIERMPEDTNAVRLVAVDSSVDEDDWIAFTPPRVPQLAPLSQVYDSSTPALLDWSVALQFPCQRSFDHFAGVTEIPEFRILPDSGAVDTLTGFQSYLGGGAMATSEAVNSSYEIPSYLRDDWARDWGSIRKYQLRTNSAGQAPDLATVDHEDILRSGLWRNSHMKIKPKWEMDD